MRIQKDIPVFQINDYHRGFSIQSLISISVHSGTRPCCQLRQDIPTVKSHGIIAGCRFLVVMRETVPLRCVWLKPMMVSSE